MAGALLAALVRTPARADLPPPAGQTRVQYLFRIDGVPHEIAVIAYPTYNSRDPGDVASLAAGEDQLLVQGYQPGLYALPAADTAGLAGLTGDAVQTYLAAHAKPCLRQIPRVFAVPTATGITRMTDVIHITTTATTCSAALVTTIYEGADGARGEGNVDTTGQRTPPAPFGRDIPDVRGFGLSLPAPPLPPPVTPAPPPRADPPQAGCAACNTGDPASPWLLTIPLALLARRPRKLVAVKVIDP